MTNLLTEIPRKNSLFNIKPVNDWIAASKKKPAPRYLFGEFWLEGELSILFADTGKGKSVLAVQIAEAIARGRRIDPLKMTGKPQKVLYLDFELTAKQFEMRYAQDNTNDQEFLIGHYKFSRNFLRAEINANAPLPDGVSFEDALIDQLHGEVKRTGARVVIVDNVTYLRSGAVRTAEAITLMKRLRELKAELGLSILVLAHTPKRHTSQPLNINDLQGSKVLANFADNIFAIGQSRYDSSHRYIKHIKPRSTEMIYDSQHVPGFVLAKSGGNFLSFTFVGWREEAVHLSSKFDSMRLDKADQMKRLADEGVTQRQIAAQFETSAASVNRHLQMLSPYDDEKARLEHERELERRREEARLAERQRVAEKMHRADERDYRRYEREIGMKGIDAGKPGAGINENVVTPVIQDLAADNEQSSLGVDDPPATEPIEPIDPRLVSPNGKPLTLQCNAYGHETYVETFSEGTGLPMVWYDHNPSGMRTRWVRGAFGIIGEVIERNHTVNVSGD